jgi:hypothetical protein
MSTQLVRLGSESTCVAGARSRPSARGTIRCSNAGCLPDHSGGGAPVSPPSPNLFRKARCSWAVRPRIASSKRLSSSGLSACCVVPWRFISTVRLPSPGVRKFRRRGRDDCDRHGEASSDAHVSLPFFCTPPVPEEDGTLNGTRVNAYDCHLLHYEAVIVPTSLRRRRESHNTNWFGDSPAGRHEGPGACG